MLHKKLFSSKIILNDLKSGVGVNVKRKKMIPEQFLNKVILCLHAQTPVAEF